MFLWDMIAMVVFIAIVGGIIIERNKSKERIELARLKSQGGDEKIAQLEERVAVLEKLVTDRRERLRDEIDAL